MSKKNYGKGNNLKFALVCTSDEPTIADSPISPTTPLTPHSSFTSHSQCGLNPSTSHISLTTNLSAEVNILQLYSAEILSKN